MVVRALHFGILQNPSFISAGAVIVLLYNTNENTFFLKLYIKIFSHVHRVMYSM